MISSVSKAVAKAGGSDGRVELNTASFEALVKLPGIGKKTAQRILEFRKQNGGFRAVDQLIKVKGIGKSKLRKLRDRVRVEALPES